MTRRIRLKLLGQGWSAFGGGTIPEDRIVEIPEADAAAFLRDRSAARKVEILGWVEENSEDAHAQDE